MTLSLAALRRHVVAAQGFGVKERGSDSDVLATVRRLSCVQLDSISVVDRSHRIVLASRVGAHDPEAASRLLAGGKLFEYWAHEASLVPMEDWPLFRRRMRERQEHHWWGPVIQRDPALARRVMRFVRDKGPVRSSNFEGRSGGMWDHKPEKRMLDALWTAGRLVVVGRPGFQRLYDVPGRVVPEDLLRARPPTQRAFLRELALRAVRARGALTLRGIVEHYRVRDPRPAVERAVGSLVREGALRRLEVEDGGADVLVDRDADPDAAPEPAASVLLSPFENLLWDRPFAKRVLGFDHLIEVYKPEAQRRFGYYALPFLVGDRIVARADVKADRAAGRLLVRRWTWEPGVRATDALKEERARAVDRLRRHLLAPRARASPRCGRPA